MQNTRICRYCSTSYSHLYLQSLQRCNHKSSSYITYTTFCLTLLFFPLLSFKSTAFATQYSGVVIDTKEQSISNAIVRLQGTSFSTLTDHSGLFCITTDDVITSKYITAWKS